MHSERKMSACCEGCTTDYFACIATFYNNNELSIEFLRKHGVLPTAVICPKCDAKCSFREVGRMWRCRQSQAIPNSKKRLYCSFSVSDYKDTFMHNVQLAPWKVILFVNHFLSKHWEHSTVTNCLKISPTTSVDWKTLCNKVTDIWRENTCVGAENNEKIDSRHQFIKAYQDKDSLIHEFFLQAAKMQRCPRGSVS